MQDFQTFLAPAKINLFLHVVGVRPDGYHLLQTVFRLIDQYDHIHLKVTTEKVIKRVEQSGSALQHIPAHHDLCIRAAMLLQQYTNCQQGVEIAVDKHIAMGAGLGGGSSDAATVLLALNKLWNVNLSRAKLLQLGLTLGADVPFFIHGNNAWAEGIGEQLQTIALKDAYYVVLNPKVHVSTAQIFANKRLTKNTNPKTMSGFSRLSNFTAGNINAEYINDLEKVVCSEYAKVLSCINWLKRFGDARMSGSGASVFLELQDAKTAYMILSQIPSEYDGFVAQGLNQHPLKDYAD